MTAPAPADPVYLTPPEVARRLRISPDRVIALIRCGELRGCDVSIRPGVGRARYRVHACDLAAWLAARLVVPPSRPTRRRRRDRPSDYVEYV